MTNAYYRVMRAGVFSIPLTVNAHHALKAAVAPRVVLLEELRRLAG